MIYLSKSIDKDVLERFLQDIPEKALNLGIRIVFALIVFFVGAQIIKFVRKILKKAIEKLSERERVIVNLRFGLESVDGQEMTQKEVANLLGISQSYISRLEKKIMKRC